jgi:hypothetical protein
MPPLLIGSDNQRRQTGNTPPFLKLGNLGLQRLRRPPCDIVAGNIDACDQALFGKRHDLIERRITHNEMLPQDTRAHDVSLQDIPLAHFKQTMSVQHRQ